jgi:hypothetical protein
VKGVGCSDLRAYCRNMIYVIGVLVAIGTVLLAVGALTGRVKATHACCSAAATPDLRLADPSYTAEPGPAT